MNIDIQNFGHYRLTSHGGRRFELFNRQADKVYVIDQSDYLSIVRAADKVSACSAIEKAYVAATLALWRS